LALAAAFFIGVFTLTDGFATAAFAGGVVVVFAGRFAVSFASAVSTAVDSAC
jgi:hypothetical protein